MILVDCIIKVESTISGGGNFLELADTTQNILECILMILGFGDTFVVGVGNFPTPTNFLLIALLTVPAIEGVYAKAERALNIQDAKMALDAPSTRVTCKAVVHAMRAKTPQTRYIAGKLGGTIRLLANLPDTWADAILRSSRMSKRKSVKRKCSSGRMVYMLSSNFRIVV